MWEMKPRTTHQKTSQLVKDHEALIPATYITHNDDVISSYLLVHTGLLKFLSTSTPIYVLVTAKDLWFSI
jgi:hypothetical protein